MPDINITFDTPLPDGFSLSGGHIVSGNASGQWASPGTTKYLAILSNEKVDLTANGGYGGISFDWGTPDRYNFVSILDTFGNVIKTFQGGDAGTPPISAQTSLFNYTVDTTTTPGGIGGVRFESTGNSFELDNVTFAKPIDVPEPGVGILFAAAVAALIVGRSRARRMRAA